MYQSIPQDVLFILQAMESHGYCTYLVGGCVRDLLLDIPPKDYDMCTIATPIQTIETLQSICTMIPTGIEFGTVTARYHQNNYEITTFRKDAKKTNGRKPEHVKFSNTIEEDVSRRDFTINAMALRYTEDAWKLIDIFGGKQDLKNGIIRCVGNPNQRFQEDYLRILRGYRFAYRYHFQIEQTTKQAMEQLANQIISHVSKPRIFLELEELLTQPHNETQWNELWILYRNLFPSIPNDDGLLVNKRSCTTNLPLRYALLFSSCTLQEIQEIFLNGSLSHPITNTVLWLIQHQQDFWPCKQADLRMWLRKEGFEKLDLLRQFQQAITNQDTSLLQRTLIEQEHHPLTHIPLCVSGKEVMKILNLTPSKQIKEILVDITQEVVRGNIDNTFLSIEQYVTHHYKKME